MAVINRTRQYTDLDLNMVPNPVTGDLSPRTGDDAVTASVRNLIMSNFYERPFRSHIGSGVSGYLFENVTPMTLQGIKQAVELVLENFEPRITVRNVVVQVLPDQNRFQVIIEYFINNQAAPVSISVFLQRVR